MPLSRSSLFVCLSVFPTLACISSASAQDASDRVVVTATRQAENIMEIPGSVVVVGGQWAETANAFDSAEEFVQLVPGVQAAVANGVQVAFQIRGIGAVDHQALTPTAAAVYSDGVFLATNVQTGLMLYDLERAEVLKGPQGTLYGRNASGGAINFISRKPGEGNADYLSLSYGTFERVDVSGAVEADLSERARLRLAGRYLSQGPLLDNVQSDPAVAAPAKAGGERDEFGLRASLAFDAGAKTQLLARVHYEEDNGTNPAPRNDSLNLDDHEISVGSDGVRDTDNAFYGGALDVRTVLAGWDVVSLSAVEAYDQNYGFDFDGTPAPFGNVALNSNLSYVREFTQLSQEVHARREWDRGSTLIGVSGALEDFSQTYTIWCGDLNEQTLVGSCNYVGAPGRVGPTPASTGNASTLITDIEQSRNTVALFTYNDFELTDRTTLTMGARYTYEDIEGEGAGYHVFDDGVVALNNRDGAGLAVGANEIEENRLSGNLALRHHIDRGGVVYASVSNGYKSGGFNGEVANNATHYQDEGLFSAETVTAYEVGYKSEASETLSWSVAGFWQDYDAPQARIFVEFPLPDGSTITSNSLSNLDAAISYGVEASLNWSPIDGLDIRSGLTVMDSEIQQDSGVNSAAFDRNPLPFASDTSFTLGARYVRSVGSNKRVGVQANAKYQSEFFLDAEGLDARRQEAYTTVDTSATYYLDDRNMELGLWVRNVLDEDYAVSGYGFIGYNTFRSAPRTYGVSLRFAH